MFLTGKFHSHITVSGDELIDLDKLQKAAHGKVTVIGLERGDKSQTDVMVTHHYVTGFKDLVDERDVLSLLKERGRAIADAGFVVSRLKLEHEPLDKASPKEQEQQSFCEQKYIEIHIKCLLREDLLPGVKECAENLGWYPSRNVFAVNKNDGTVVQFLNKRYYKPESVDQVRREYRDFISNIQDHPGFGVIKEVKFESAVYDSNDTVDKWWME